jgi:hypothetical protein
MDRRFIVRPLTEADLEQAANWYDEEQAGLGLRFLSDVDQVFERIRERPQQFPAVSGDMRRALLHTFPYAVYFRETDETIRVLACAASATQTWIVAGSVVTTVAPETIVGQRFGASRLRSLCSPLSRP